MECILITQTPPNTRINPTLPPLRFGNAGYAERWAAGRTATMTPSKASNLIVTARLSSSPKEK
jgi:hypothetical protein